MNAFVRFMIVISLTISTYLVVAFIFAIIMADSGWNYADHKIFFHVITSGSALFVALFTVYELFIEPN